MWYRFIISSKQDVMTILNNDQQKFDLIKNLKLNPKFETTAAWLLHQTDISQVQDLCRKLKILDDKKPININTNKNGVHYNGHHFTDYMKFAEAVDASYTLISYRPKYTVEPEENEVGKIKIFKADNVGDTIKYGQGTPWCIAQPGNTYYQSYRDLDASTFYFIFDGTRDKNDPLSRVVLDMNKHGCELTDLNNTTGTIEEFGKNSNEYLKYLQDKGVDINQFKNIPKSEKEIEENRDLGKRILSLQFFQRLSYDYKTKYIGRGHILTNEQLEYLIHNNAKDLISQYLDTGISIPPSQIKMISNKEAFLNTYKRKQKISLEQIINFYNNSIPDLGQVAAETKNYELMDYVIKKNFDPDHLVKTVYDEYEREGYNTNIAYIELQETLWWLLGKGASPYELVGRLPTDIKTLKTLVNKAERGEKISTAGKAILYCGNNLDDIKWMVENGADAKSGIRRYLSRGIITNDFEIIKWFVDHGLDPSTAAFYTTNPEIWRWLIEKHNADPDYVGASIMFGGGKHAELFPWLIQLGSTNDGVANAYKIRIHHII